MNAIASVRDDPTTRPLVLLVEDEVLVRTTLTSVLDRARFKVIAASNADEALEVLASVSGISIVVTDVKLSLSSIDGFELARKVWKERRIPVLVASGRVAPYEEELPSAIHFIAKPIHPATLAYMIRTAIGEGTVGGSPSAPDPIQREDKPSLLSSSDLTSRQRQVLELLVKGKTNRDIAAALNLAPGTVKVHVSSLFRKLGVTSRTAAVAAGIRMLQSM